MGKFIKEGNAQFFVGQTIICCAELEVFTDLNFDLLLSFFE